MSSCALQNPDAGSNLSEHVKQYHTMQAGDMDYISKNIKRNVPHELNLAHDAQYRYVLHNLREGGDSPEKSPALYEHLKWLRDSALKVNKGNMAPTVLRAFMATSPNEGSVGPLSDINLLTSLYSTDQVNYTTSGLSSIYNGCSSTTMQFNLRTVQTNTPFYVSPGYKAFGPATENWSQSTTASVPPAQKNENVVSTILIIPSPSALGSGGAITMSSEDFINATDQCVTAPNYGTYQDPSVIPCPPPTATCINKGDVSQPIVSCYGRNSYQARATCGACNYGYPAPGHPDSLSLMVSGSITFPNPIATDALGNPIGQLVMYLQQSNGGCILKSQYSDSGPLPANFSVNGASPNVLNYCFIGGDFTSATCFKDLVNSTVDLNMEVYVMLNVSSGSNYAQAKVSSNNCGTVGQPWCANVPEICIFQGCLEKGTLITLADGSTKKVEDFKGGERVKSSGTDRTVGSTTSGNEWVPMYRIKTQNGKMVLISGKHAVPTTAGMKLVRNLMVGDVVKTDQGDSKISEIIKEMYSGTVHNFMVGDEKDVEKGLANMYANGILVGDLASQQYYTRAHRTKKFSVEELKSQVDKKWHEDLENHLNAK